MNVMQVVPSDGRLVLKPAQVPKPIPAAGEVQIRVHAAGVTPTELLWYPTTHTTTGAARTLAIPGHEFSGIIEQAGHDVASFAVGDAVFGMNDWFADGATAEYCTAAPAWIAAKPSNLTHAEAATVPIGALTAWQGLFTRANLQPGETVLIHGGAGSVGLFAIQLAAAHGATVITTASSANLPLVTRLGAHTAIDYKALRFEDIARGVDLVFDTVGGETLARSWTTLRPGGRLVTIAADAEGQGEQRVKDAFFIVQPDGEQLAEIGRRLASGRLQAFVKAALPFDQAPAAYADSVSGKLGHGKVVITLQTP